MAAVAPSRISDPLATAIAEQHETLIQGIFDEGASRHFAAYQRPIDKSAMEIYIGKMRGHLKQAIERLPQQRGMQIAVIGAAGPERGIIKAFASSHSFQLIDADLSFASKEFRGTPRVELTAAILGKELFLEIGQIVTASYQGGRDAEGRLIYFYSHIVQFFKSYSPEPDGREFASKKRSELTICINVISEIAAHLMYYIQQLGAPLAGGKEALAAISRASGEILKHVGLFLTEAQQMEVKIRHRFTSALVAQVRKEGGALLFSDTTDKFREDPSKPGVRELVKHKYGLPPDIVRQMERSVGCPQIEELYWPASQGVGGAEPSEGHRVHLFYLPSTRDEGKAAEPAAAAAAAGAGAGAGPGAAAAAEG